MHTFTTTKLDQHSFLLLENKKAFAHLSAIAQKKSTNQKILKYRKVTTKEKLAYHKKYKGGIN